MPVKARKIAVRLLLVLAIPAGVGVFTFGYAKGFSYLSTDPKACVNCHVMNEQYDAWQKSGHRHAATCVDCHLPHSGLAKWVAKADHGFRHSAAFTLQNFKEPIEITPADRVMVLDNCLRCHGHFVAAVHTVATPSMKSGKSGKSGEPLDCLHCHQGAGHRASD